MSKYMLPELFFQKVYLNTFYGTFGTWPNFLGKVQIMPYPGVYGFCRVNDPF